MSEERAIGYAFLLAWAITMAMILADWGQQKPAYIVDAGMLFSGIGITLWLAGAGYFIGRGSGRD